MKKYSSKLIVGAHLPRRIELCKLSDLCPVLERYVYPVNTTGRARCSVTDTSHYAASVDSNTDLFVLCACFPPGYRTLFAPQSKTARVAGLNVHILLAMHFLYEVDVALLTRNASMPFQHRRRSAKSLELLLSW